MPVGWVYPENAIITVLCRQSTHSLVASSRSNDPRLLSRAKTDYLGVPDGKGKGWKGMGRNEEKTRTESNDKPM